MPLLVFRIRIAYSFFANSNHYLPYHDISAKIDERSEFNRMIRFVKNQQQGVAAILVCSLDLFSRTGDNAIFISSEVKKQGISILSVTQPIDAFRHVVSDYSIICSKYMTTHAGRRELQE